MSETKGLLAEFLAETHENLDQLERDLLSIEGAPYGEEVVKGIFRAIHTLKGSCGFFGFAKLEEITHACEDLLCLVRDGSALIGPEIHGALLDVVDAIRVILARVEANGGEGEVEYTALVDRLTTLTNGAGPCASLSRGRNERVTTPDEGEREPSPDGATPVAAREGSHAATTVRVRVELLDRLMDLAGELVLARNQLARLALNRDDDAFLSPFGRIDKATSGLHGEIAKIRMQPIATLWDTFPRVVRDLEAACGKRVRVVMEGRATEMDRTLLEAIKDPLLHALRNAVDHGIEVPEVRSALGKPPEGLVRLGAFQRGGRITIEVSDDGRGIDPERIRSKALERGVISHAQADRLVDRELLQLIFLPGFSTADRVTTVSGRGVGMDVVKSNVERIGGTVGVRSRPGRGTTLEINIPLTLALIPALIVGEGDERYAIPQSCLKELLRIGGTGPNGGIETVQGAPVFRHRGGLLTLVDLGRELECGAGPAGDGRDATNLVVLMDGDRTLGLRVEQVFDLEEIVVKPLDAYLGGTSLFSGATVLGDGKMALILDVGALARRACAAPVAVEPGPAEGGATTTEGGREVPRTMLIFGVGAHRRMAVAFDRVTRLEEIPASAVERADGREAVLHGGEIIPLIRLEHVLDGGPDAVAVGGGRLKVIVCHEGGRRVGLAVDRIDDVVETPILLHRADGRHGLLGAAMIGDRLTDLLDLPGVVRSTAPTFFERPGASSGPGGR